MPTIAERKAQLAAAGKKDNAPQPKQTTKPGKLGDDLTAAVGAKLFGLQAGGKSNSQAVAESVTEVEPKKISAGLAALRNQKTSFNAQEETNRVNDKLSNIRADGVPPPPPPRRVGNIPPPPPPRAAAVAIGQTIDKSNWIKDQDGNPIKPPPPPRKSGHTLG